MHHDVITCRARSKLCPSQLLPAASCKAILQQRNSAHMQPLNLAMQALTPVWYLHHQIGFA